MSDNIQIFRIGLEVINFRVRGDRVRFYPVRNDWVRYGQLKNDYRLKMISFQTKHNYDKKLVLTFFIKYM